MPLTAPDENLDGDQQLSGTGPNEGIGRAKSGLDKPNEVSQWYSGNPKLRELLLDPN